MTKIRKDGQTIEIDCEHEMCGNCEHKPIAPGQECKLFKILIDHVSTGSGWKRHNDCINAEVR